MREHYQTFVKSAAYALEGIRQALRYEVNLRYQVFSAICVITAGFCFQISQVEWLILSLTITLVIFAELMNTALESNVDLFTKEHHPEAKLAKDVAAGAVLITSLNAIIVGCIIFIPYLWRQ